MGNNNSILYFDKLHLDLCNLSKIVIPNERNNRKEIMMVGLMTAFIMSFKS